MATHGGAAATSGVSAKCKEPLPVRGTAPWASVKGQAPKSMAEKFFILPSWCSEMT